MSTTAQELADRFKRGVANLIRAVEAGRDTDFARPCADTGWSVLVQLDHLALVENLFADYLDGFRMSQPKPPLTMEAIHATNDRRAAAATIDKDTVVTGLRASGQRMAALIRGLSNDQLEHEVEIITKLGPRSVRRSIEILCIGEIEGHDNAINQCLSA